MTRSRSPYSDGSRRPAGGGVGERDRPFGHRRQPAQRRDRLGGRVTQLEALVFGDQLAALETVVVDHGAHAGLELLEDPVRVLDAVVEVGAPGVAALGPELGDVVDVGRQRADLPLEIVQELRQPLPAVDDVAGLRALRAFDAAKQRARPQQRPHPGPPFVHVGGRLEHGVGAGLEREHPLARLVAARAQDRGNEVGPDIGLEALHQLDAAVRRHAVVNQHDVGRVQQRLLERGVGVRDGPDVDAFVAQEADQRPRHGAPGRHDQPFDLAGQRELVLVCSPLVGEHRCRARRAL